MNMSRTQTKKYLWKNGDTFRKISYIHYNNSKFWKVIAEFNGYTLEWQPSVGTIIKIPTLITEDVNVNIQRLK